MTTKSITTFSRLSRPDSYNGIFVLNDNDRSAVIQHFLSLTPEDRRSRFGANLSDEALHAWLDTLKLDGLFAGLFENGVLRGVGCVVTEPSGTHGELGVSIDGAMRSMGWGHRLVSFALELAYLHGVFKVVIYYHANNDAMARIANRLPGDRSPLQADRHVEVDVCAWVGEALSADEEAVIAA